MTVTWATACWPCQLLPAHCQALPTGKVDVVLCALLVGPCALQPASCRCTFTAQLRPHTDTSPAQLRPHAGTVSPAQLGPHSDAICPAQLGPIAAAMLSAQLGPLHPGGNWQLVDPTSNAVLHSDLHFHLLIAGSTSPCQRAAAASQQPSQTGAHPTKMRTCRRGRSSWSWSVRSITL